MALVKKHTLVRKEAIERDRLVAGCQGLVRSIAWKIRQKLPEHIDLDDLIAYGNLGLTQAANSFDPETSHQFTTFAYHRIRGAILDGLRQMSWFNISNYHRGHYEQLACDVVGTSNELQQDSSDLADDIQWLGKVCSRLSVVQMLHSAREVEGTDDRDSCPIRSAISHEIGKRLTQLVEKLPNEQRKLIQSTYYQGMSLTQAGERQNRSRSWASRLHTVALDRLERELKAIGIDEE